MYIPQIGFKTSLIDLTHTAGGRSAVCTSKKKIILIIDNFLTHYSTFSDLVAAIDRIKNKS